MMKLFHCMLTTIQGVDTITAAKLLSEIGDINRFPNADKLARFAGIAPVNFSSAGKGKDKKSKQGNGQLYGVFYFLAVQQVQVSSRGTPRNPVFLGYYKKKVSEGKTNALENIKFMNKIEL